MLALLLKSELLPVKNREITTSEEGKFGTRGALSNLKSQSEAGFSWGAFF